MSTEEQQDGIEPPAPRVKNYKRLDSMVNEPTKKQMADSNNYEALRDMAQFLQSALKITVAPTVAIICGTGLNHLANQVTDPQSVTYEAVPGFPVSTVKGHSGQLVYGRLQGKYVICMQGRLHPYEGYSLATCSLPMRVMKLLGVKTLLMTSAVGGINKQFQLGDLMMIKDHISIPGFAGRGPLTGPNPDEFGPRFFGMVNAYDRDLRAKVRKLAVDRQFTSLRDGVYAQIGGPQFETPAEIRALRTLGADVVGMSVCHETIIARHCGMRVLAFALVTNLSIDDSDAESVTGVHEEVLEMGAQRSEPVSDFIHAVMAEVL